MSDTDRLWQELYRQQDTLISLIVWMAQAANSPITAKEAELLIAKLQIPTDAAKTLMQDHDR